MGQDGVTYYNILVSCSGSTRLVRHRYCEFLELHVHLSPKMVLPPMPPKSTFRIRFSRSFQARRREQLESILLTAVREDPALRVTELRTFLRVSQSGRSIDSRSGPSIGSTRP